MTLPIGAPLTQSEIIQLSFGDTVPLGQVLANIILMGIITDINNPNLFAATLEAYRDQAVLTLPVLQGPKGDPGQPVFALRWQNDNITSPSQLPTVLTDLPGDLGKFWVFGVTDQNGNVVGTTMYVWWGTRIGFRQLPVGAPGPPGPYPIITPNIKLEVPGSGLGPGGVDSWVAATGSIADPVFTFHIAAPQGIPGPSAALATSPDIDFTTRAPVAGDVLQCTGNTVVVAGVPRHVWANVAPVPMYPSLYTIPETAFTSISGIGNATQQVCTFPVPSQAFAWKPFVWGQMQILGLNLALQVGAEVRLGNPTTGPVIARGFSNTDGYVTLIPHTSFPGNTSASMTTTNMYAKVPANHADPLGTLYVSLINEGLSIVYDFHAANATLSVLAMPVPT
jgi:hypothetical protein